jgi:diketogulonate reductase-like aldo/keto reductase
MNKILLSRRAFATRSAAFAVSWPAIGTLVARPAHAVTAVSALALKPGGRTVKFPDGAVVPALGQGCWHLGQGRHPPASEEEALHTGISLGMSLIDTSGNYGNGLSEQFLSHAIAGQREHLFLVSKVEGNQVEGDGIARACEASLARLKTDYLDLYLLHWPVASSLFAGIVAAFEKLRAARKIRAWGVSNFSTGQMEDLFEVPDGKHCATNQVPYSLNNRGIERRVLPWCHEHNVPVMAYSPLGGDNHLVIGDHTLAQLGASHGCSAAAIALAWAIRGGNVIAIPESGSPEHTKQNAVALSLTLTAQDLQTLEQAFPA